MFLTFLIIHTIINTSLAIISSEKYQIINAVAFSRHGNRSAIYFMDGDAALWPEGPGQLLKSGKIAAYQLGVFYHTRYVLKNALISEKYMHDEVYIRSTDVDRTLMTAYCVEAGLFFPSADEMWNSQIKWQPIPTHTKIMSNDHLLLTSSCPKLVHHFNEIKKSIYLKYDIEYKDLFEYVSKKLNKTFTMATIWKIGDNMLCKIQNNFDTPEWSKKPYKESKTYADYLLYLHEISFNIKYGDKELVKFGGGYPIFEVIDQFEEFVNNENKIKFIYNSAHDTTLTIIMNALKIYDGTAPSYASSLIFELLKDESNQLFVSVLYKNTDTNVVEFKKIEGCSTYCPFEKFKLLMKEIATNDTLKYCVYKNRNTNMKNTLLIWLIIISTVSFILLIFIIAYYIRSKKK
ncbi:hypothetical protein A3Q56_01878 [Intoshia linei]|uniref:acid phosphatase n=1 Tax=Intoshia linei TaxID=1819745 RepID=A0A177B890_9BILA|nr:hypothetical protein A3Q56_01878 [Intoshia linei]